MYIRTKEENFIRDTNSRALIIDDSRARERFRQQKLLEQRVNTIENRMNEMNEKLDKLITILHK